MDTVKVVKTDKEVTQWVVPTYDSGGVAFGAVTVELKRWAYRGLPVPGFAGVSADAVGALTLYVTPAFPEEMYAIVLIAHDNAGGNPYAEWDTEIPAEQGYYWFHGTSDAMRRHVDYKTINGWLESTPNPRPAKTIMIMVKQAGGVKPFAVYISGGAYVYPKQEGYIGYWLKFDPPTPPKNLEKGVDKPGGKG